MSGLTAGIAHEIRNPMQFIRNFAEMVAELSDEMAEIVEEGALDAPLRSDLATLHDELSQASGRIVENTERVEGLVAAISFTSADYAGHRLWNDINQVVERAIESAADQVRAARMLVVPPITKDLDRSLPPVQIDTVAVTYAIRNLLVNALEAAATGGTDEPAVAVATTRIGDEIVVSVTDSGQGIDLEIADRVFDPFFTTWAGRGHAGLGLTLARDILRSHHGTVELVTDRSGRTLATVRLPL